MRVIRSRRGFSLMEILVALALTGLILAMTVPLFRSQVQGYEKNAGRFDAQQNARYAISMIDRELRAAGVGLPDQQPMLIQAAPYAITFSGDLASRLKTDVSAVYYDPDILDGEVIALGKANRITLPLSAVMYPDTTYTQQGGAPSQAETISFWVAPDPTAGGLSVLYRRVNNSTPTIVAKSLRVTDAEPVFRYYKAAVSGPPIEIPKAQLPIYHTAPIHGSKLDSAASARTDSIRIVRIKLDGIYVGRNGVTLIRPIETGVRIMNAGLLHHHTCGEPPIFTSDVTTSTATDPQPLVNLAWNASLDEAGGEKDVQVYAIYKRAPAGEFTEPFASVPAGATSYSYTDTQVTSGEEWVYGVIAVDCENQASGIKASSQVTVP